VVKEGLHEDAPRWWARRRRFMLLTYKPWQPQAMISN
jgi:hypothetical protein